MWRIRPDGKPGHSQPPRTERLRNEWSGAGVMGHEAPWLVDKFGEFDLAASQPFAARACHHDERVLEQDFGIQILGLNRRHQSTEYEVDLALAQVAVLGRSPGCLHHSEPEARILP